MQENTNEQKSLNLMAILLEINRKENHNVIISNKIAIKFSSLLINFSAAVNNKFPPLLFFFGNIPFIWNKIPFNALSLSNHNAFHRVVKCYFF